MSTEVPIVIAAPALVLPPAKLAAVAQVGDKNIAPTTTAAEDETKLGQRRVNLIWETMQACIAAAVVGTSLYVAANLALFAISGQADEKQAAVAVTAFMLISNLASLVIGFYFGRTNHQRTSGVGQYDLGR